MTEPHAPPTTALPDLADFQHWTWLMGRAQQLMLEAGIPLAPPASLAEQTRDFWSDYLALWQRFTTPAAPETERAAEKDRRFANPAWRSNPAFDWMRQSYALIADHLLRGVDALEGVDERTRAQLKFATSGFVDAMSPSNFAATNPEVIEKTIETRGQNLLTGLTNMLSDIGRGQVTHADGTAFEIGRNLAATPGKVVKRTALYELIQYAPATDTVLATPLLIFPPWINRFYVLDLSPEKSFIRWAVAQGITVFMVSWKSADASMAEVIWDDYVAAQVEAIDTVRALLDVPAVHTVGYCVAGTTLAATLAWLAAKEQAGKVASATFLTAQVDFMRAGELLHFVDDEQLKMIATLSPQGFLDGRYLAATFNLLRGRDLIWNYVTNNYLLGKEYAPFDLLHWNADVTNLPAKWHLAYLTDLYRDNLLVQPGAMRVGGVPLDLATIETPAYVQAGREDHIAPAESVWKLTEHLRGPLRFVLAGSGHIAGVVNPPAAGKYQHWINDQPADSLDAFVAGAREVKGSWWNDWAEWLRAHAPVTVAADGARVPGAGALAAIEDAPGSYVRAR